MERMKRWMRRSALLAASAIAVLLLLCSCGSELDGTWTSNSDEDTRIKISGENVRIYYDDFKIEGTYETDDYNKIIFHLTDKNGNKYKIMAVLNYEKKRKTLTLTNSKGETEVFAR